MNKIPKIIHQIWSGIEEPLPEHFKELGETWKEHYPGWKYELWDNDRMNKFILEYYPEYQDIYQRFPFHVQRWDAIRYLILDKIGGMYVDFDYESIKPLDNLINDKNCCFAMEKKSHAQQFKRKEMFNNALMLSEPQHPFMKLIIENVFSEKALTLDSSNKFLCVLNSTGPWILMDLYEQLPEKEKENIYLVPDQYVTPFDVIEAFRFKQGEISDELEICLKEAYAVHYYFDGWKGYMNI